MRVGAFGNRSPDVNPSKKPAGSVTEDKSKSPLKEENKKPKSEDFPSGDEADREDGNAGPEEKRKP